MGNFDSAIFCPKNAVFSSCKKGEGDIFFHERFELVMKKNIFRKLLFKFLKSIASTAEDF